MKAIIQDRYGSPDVLELSEIDRPAVKDDEVLVRVRAASVNPPEWAIVGGVPYVARAAFGLRRPRIRVRGTDLAGTVEAVGGGVTRLHVGDDVFGAGVGTFAEYAVAPERQLVTKPADLSFEQAASVPMAGLTALQALRDQGRVQPGQKVLINGAGGGIGTFAVQIAKIYGADVTGVCSTSKVDLVRSLGADHVIDYTREDFTQGAERYDFILDNVLRHSLSSVRNVLTPTGTLVPNAGRFDRRVLGSVVALFVQAPLMSRFGSRKLRPFLSLPKQDDLLVLRELLLSGKVTPVIDRTYPLKDAAEAIRHFGEGHARGKVVLTI